MSLATFWAIYKQAHLVTLDKSRQPIPSEQFFIISV
jgi:hypothetical protein